MSIGIFYQFYDVGIDCSMGIHALHDSRKNQISDSHFYVFIQSLLNRPPQVLNNVHILLAHDNQICGYTHRMNK
jgi:hypothetical protein